ncbi:hypothetical protein BKG83_20885 [Mycobacteroides chelonae]|jgi:hypothetical protein|uniref:Uncharacterized protein n=1 Tax=Mycobacteroides chelonae TaxID=1774 RepID=A0A1S1LTX7_MYCCH|nr:ribbon-helix-helix protein, CopG family [Mycobacteroides chelonae]MBF9521956.1 TraB/GumN family protein [Mycobacteroides chelonae]OHU49792.1 hypothetical protein BKG83_20885 [Mycobacteroides chelonae]OHU75809.1 hypothetical protein BKG84_26560 [Mycobacteroides chelonae]SKO33556.1 Ribbon-helix-helix protein, copG family [Mycobacteroides abscessus subsp. bolletii]
MSKKKDLDAFLEEEGNAIEADADAPITDATKVTRGHPKTRTLQVRLSPEEYEGLEKIADERGLSVSTVAREHLQKLLLASTSSPAAERLIAEFGHYVHGLDKGRRLKADVVFTAGPRVSVPSEAPTLDDVEAIGRRMNEALNEALRATRYEDARRYVEQTMDTVRAMREIDPLTQGPSVREQPEGP